MRASCPAGVTLEQHFAGSAVVFVGRATARKTTAAPLPKDWTTLTTFEVEDVWKGPTEATISITTCGGAVEGIAESVTCSESMAFRFGARYLVFASSRVSIVSTSEPRPRTRAPTASWIAPSPHCNGFRTSRATTVR